MSRICALLLTLALFVACEQVDLTEGDSPGNVTFTIISGTISGASDAELFAEGPGNIPMEAVDALNMSLTRLEVRRDEQGPWIDVPLEDGQVLALDMLEIPEETPLVLAEASLGPDIYTDVRLFLSAAGLDLNEEVCLGPEDPADQTPVDLCVSGTVDVFFPSGDQTGVKTDAYFEVTDGSQVEVTLVFDPTATVGSISWAPGLGQVVVSPVIRAADTDGGA